MLKDIGVEWVILGHSERRALLGESSEVRLALCLQHQARNVGRGLGRLGEH